MGLLPLVPLHDLFPATESWRIHTLKCSNSVDEVKEEGGVPKGQRKPPPRAPVQGRTDCFHFNIKLASCSHAGSLLVSSIKSLFPFHSLDFFAPFDQMCF